MADPEKALDPEVMQVVLLQEIQKYMKEARAEGIVEPLKSVSVTDAPKQIRAPYKPWFTVELLNDGPNTVHAIFNTEKSFDEHEIRKGESCKVEMGRGIIKDVYVKCDKGERAKIRLVGTR